MILFVFANVQLNANANANETQRHERSSSARPKSYAATGSRRRATETTREAELARAEIISRLSEAATRFPFSLEPHYTDARAPVRLRNRNGRSAEAEAEAEAEAVDGARDAWINTASALRAPVNKSAGAESNKIDSQERGTCAAHVRKYEVLYAFNLLG